MASFVLGCVLSRQRLALAAQKNGRRRGGCPLVVRNSKLALCLYTGGGMPRATDIRGFCALCALCSINGRLATWLYTQYTATSRGAEPEMSLSSFASFKWQITNNGGGILLGLLSLVLWDCARARGIFPPRERECFPVPRTPIIILCDRRELCSFFFLCVIFSLLFVLLFSEVEALPSCVQIAFCNTFIWRKQ